VISLHIDHVFLKAVNIKVARSGLFQVLKLLHGFMFTCCRESFTQEITELVPIEQIYIDIAASQPGLCFASDVCMSPLDFAFITDTS
jgi:hypothetical protein